MPRLSRHRSSSSSSDSSRSNSPYNKRQIGRTGRRRSKSLQRKSTRSRSPHNKPRSPKQSGDRSAGKSRNSPLSKRGPPPRRRSNSPYRSPKHAPDRRRPLPVRRPSPRRLSSRSPRRTGAGSKGGHSSVGMRDRVSAHSQHSKDSFTQKRHDKSSIPPDHQSYNVNRSMPSVSQVEVRNQLKDVDYRVQPAGGDYARAPVTTEVPAKAEKPPFSTTVLKLDSRFELVEKADNPKTFKPGEVITIGIEREILGEEPAIIPQTVQTGAVVLPRRRGEGEQPLSLRKEFETREGEDILERRVVKVKGTGRNTPPSASEHRSDSRRSQVVTLNDRWAAEAVASTRTALAGGPQIVKCTDTEMMTKRTLEKSSKIERDDNEHMMAKKRRSGNSREDEDLRLGYNPNDLRHNLERRRAEGSRSLNDARERISRRKQHDELHHSSTDGGDTRMVEKGRQTEELPDFSKRPEKFLPQWKINPTIIPTAGYYFEHDNRDSCDYWTRGHRGWRGGRGGRGRGHMQDRSSRPYYSRRSAPDTEWKHDKFQETEEPSSTT